MRRDASGGEPAEEVLASLRVPLVRRAELSLRGEQRTAYLLDVGLRGVFVEWQETLPIGEGVEVAFHLPGSEKPVRARSRVAWWNPPGESARARRLPGGVGLEFVELPEADRRRIRALVLDHLRGDLSSRRFHPAWPETPGESESG